MASATTRLVSSIWKACFGVDPSRVGEHVTDRRRIGVPTEKLVERHQPELRDLAEGALEVFERHVHVDGELLLGRRTLHAVLELGERPLDLPGARPDRARDPVEGPQLVEDRPLDPVDGIGLELEPTLELELVDGVDETKDPVGDEIGLVDIAG